MVADVVAGLSQTDTPYVPILINAVAVYKCNDPLSDNFCGSAHSANLYAVFRVARGLITTVIWSTTTNTLLDDVVV
jgi:hypothetical protein